MPLRRLVLSGLIAASSGLAAQSVALSGNTETLVGYSLPGVTVSLANAGISVVDLLPLNRTVQAAHLRSYSAGLA